MSVYNDLFYDETVMLLQKENAELIEQVYELTQELKAFKDEKETKEKDSDSHSL